MKSTATKNNFLMPVMKTMAMSMNTRTSSASHVSRLTHETSGTY